MAHGLAPEMLPVILKVPSLLDEVTLEDGVANTIRWRFMFDGKYTTHSAYMIQFTGAIKTDTVEII